MTWLLQARREGATFVDTEALKTSTVATNSAKHDENFALRAVTVIIVDAQQCFSSEHYLAEHGLPRMVDGEACQLPVPEGEAIVPSINQLCHAVRDQGGGRVHKTRDWHPRVLRAAPPACNPAWVPEDSAQLFKETTEARATIKKTSTITTAINTQGAPIEVDRYWPRHAEARTSGSDYLEGLYPTHDVEVKKGTAEDWHPYGGCFLDLSQQTPSESLLDLYQQQTQVVVVTGLAFDFCVWETIEQLLDQGFLVVVPLEATRGVDPVSCEKKRALLERWQQERLLIVTETVVQALAEVNAVLRYFNSELGRSAQANYVAELANNQSFLRTAP